MSARPCQAALEHALDARSLNHAQARALINLDTPEVDSLVEAIIRLPGISDQARRTLARHADQIISLNDREGQSEHAAIGALDPLDRRGLRPGIKQLAAQLRPLLTDQPRGGKAVAWRTIRGLVESPHVGPAVLRSTAMRHELGAGPHDRLLPILDALEGATP